MGRVGHVVEARVANGMDLMGTYGPPRRRGDAIATAAIGPALEVSPEMLRNKTGLHNACAQTVADRRALSML